MTGEFLRRGEGARSNAKEEAEMLVYEFRLEGPDDGTRVAKEGRWGDKGGTGVAGGRWETPDGGAVSES
jgi:hypothetical protein